MPAGGVDRRLSVADRHAVAACLRAADQGLADAVRLSRPAPRSAVLLLGAAIDRLAEAVSISEHGLAWRSQHDAPAALDPANPLQPALLRLSAFADAACRAAPPGADGRLPALPEAAVLAAHLAELSATIAEAAHGFAVALDEADTPAGRSTRLRPPPAQPPPAPPRPAEPRPAVITTPDKRASPATAGHAVPAGEPIAPRQPGPIGAAPFWSLADRWQLGDLEALALIGHQGGLTKKGTRPRFRLDGDEATQFGLLLELDTSLRAASLDPASWLRQPLRAPPFAGRTPLAHIAGAGASGARDVLRHAVQEGLRRSIAG